MRISDWSSDVCSSDLFGGSSMNALNPSDPTPEQKRVLDRILWRVMPFVTLCMVVGTIDRSNVGFAKISMAVDLGMSEAVFALMGRASSRESECQYVADWVVGGALMNKTKSNDMKKD